MAKQRYISSEFWLDSYIQELSVSEKLLYIYLFTNSHVDLCGVYEITEKTISFESGIGFESLRKALKGFAKNEKIYYYRGWLCIKNFKRHLRVNPNVQKGIERAESLIPTDITKAFERLSKHSTLIPIPNGDNLSEKPNGITPTGKPECGRKKFQIPREEEVLKFFSENNSNKIQSEDFRDFYASKDWMVGKNKMKDWKAAARRWIRSNPVASRQPLEY